MERSEASGNDKNQRLHWHPAFYAGMQIELQDEADKLSYQEEYLLGKEPMRMDMLLIKKNTKDKIQKNIGQIFRKYNIIEYKSPTDYLSIDDFYKVYSYAFAYKANTGKEYEISIEELTITYVCNHYPRHLVTHLKQIYEVEIEQIEPGIYYLPDARFIVPIQIIVTKELTDEKNLWLHNLTDSLQDTDTVKRLLSEYENQKKNTLYQSVMEIIVNANKEKFGEVKEMCNALLELMKDDLDERERIGEARGEQQGELRVNRLVVELFSRGRTNDLIRSATDSEYQKKLFAEFHL